jgi:hypothetical protein
MYCCAAWQANAVALYLDDQLSGVVITNNTFENCQLGIQLGGGRYNNGTQRVSVATTVSSMLVSQQR